MEDHEQDTLQIEGLKERPKGEPQVIRHGPRDVEQIFGDYNPKEGDRKVNNSRVNEFVQLIPDAPPGLEQVLSAFVNKDWVKNKYPTRGKVHSIHYDGDSVTIENLSLTPSMRVSGSLQTLYSWYSLEANGINPPEPQSEIDREFPMYALIKHVAQTDPDRLDVVHEFGSTVRLGPIRGSVQSIAVRGRQGAILATACIDDFPLNDTERKMLEYVKAINQEDRARGELYDQIERGVMKKNESLLYRIFRREAHMPLNSMKTDLYDLRTQTTNRIFEAKMTPPPEGEDASYVQSFDPRPIEKSLRKSQEYRAKHSPLIREA
ncbi:hypothetical protein ACFL3V_04615 [Nanoarchaeota archaeon]